jgi:hypothetical protein
MHGMNIKLWYVYSCCHHPEDGSMNDRNMSVFIYVMKLHSLIKVHLLVFLKKFYASRDLFCFTKYLGI